MRIFFKKYMKPFLKVTGLYDRLRHLFLSVLVLRIKIVNLFYKIFYKTAPILLYHRISKVSADPTLLCVTPECFESHLKFLKEHYDVIPLSVLSERLMAGTLKGNEAAVTFDDGYNDNLINALPLLEKYNVPSTIFITTGSLGERASFEWDMGYKELDRAIFLNEKEIILLANHPLIEIGAHTVTHPSLANIPPERQKEEIIESRAVLERITGKNIKSFAYPFGGAYDINNLSRKIIEKAGFDFAYSNIQSLAVSTNNRFCIPRINIRECTVTDLSRKIICKIGIF